MRANPLADELIKLFKYENLKMSTSQFVYGLMTHINSKTSVDLIYYHQICAVQFYEV